MDNVICQTEGVCQNFFHPRNAMLDQSIYQASDSLLNQETLTPAAKEEATASFESPVFRLIRERLTWIESQEECTIGAAEAAVTGFKQLLTLNSTIAASAKAAPSPKTTQTQLKVHEQVMLETIWKKQVDKTSLKTNLFGGRGVPSTELSVNQVRLGRA